MPYSFMLYSLRVLMFVLCSMTLLVLVAIVDADSFVSVPSHDDLT